MRRLIWLIESPLVLARSCCLFLAILGLLLVLGSCLGIGWGLGRASADEMPMPTPQPAAPPVAQTLDACLIIDQSDSLWTMGGSGSDPQQLRMSAARLFAARLGVEPSWKARLALLYFGTAPRLVMPLSELAAPETQQALDGLGEPPRLGWTDIASAVAMAETELYTGPRAAPERRKVVVIFTDGRPDTGGLGKPEALPAYLDDLEARINRLTQRGALVFTVLLRNAATDADPLLQHVYRPFWGRLAERGGSVRFYDVTTPEDLVQTYADIAMLLGPGISAGTVVSQDVGGGARASMQVSTGWRRATLVVRRSQPAMAVTIARPDGRVLRPDDPDLSHQAAERDGIEVWAVDAPAPGEWQVLTQGNGSVTVRLDYEPLPATAIAPATATASPTATPSATSTVTFTPSPPPGLNPTPTSTLVSIALIPFSAAAGGSTSTSLPPPDSGSPGRAQAPVVLGLSALLMGLGAWYIRRRGTAAATLTLDGDLRVLTAPAEHEGGQTWNLAHYRQPDVVIGAPPSAQVVLTRTSTGLPSLRLQRRGGAGNGAGTWLVVQDRGKVHVNGTLVHGERRLSGWDTIEVGGWKLRYENFRERARSHPSVRAARTARR